MNLEERGICLILISNAIMPETRANDVVRELMDLNGKDETTKDQTTPNDTETKTPNDTPSSILDKLNAQQSGHQTLR